MKEVILLGQGHTRTLCPFDKEVWSINDSWWGVPRIDLIFELHNHVVMGFYDKLKESQNKVMLKAPVEGLNYLVYPIDEIIRAYNTRYFATTTAYLIAYAMYMNYERLWLYGIDHSFRNEYVLTKACVEYWVGRAEQAGIEVIIPEDSALCKTPENKLYAYEFGAQYNSKAHEKILIENTIV